MSNRNKRTGSRGGRYQQQFNDGLKNVQNQLINNRNPQHTNQVASAAIDGATLRQIYKTGLGSKITRLKAGSALDGTLEFDTEAERELYEDRLSKHVKQAAIFMQAFGRGIIVLFESNDDLSKPLRSDANRDRLQMRVFDGDMVTVGDVSIDLTNERYQKPVYYIVRGQMIHWSRVVDFTYVQPTETDAPLYRYGGISEFELIYSQIINDGVIERAAGRIVDVSSNLFYKVKGFKQLMEAKKDSHIVEYFSRVENFRGIWGATLMDSEDEVENVTQTLSNLSEVDQITLRRLAMVTGIPLAVLVGENVKGLNSTGENEMIIYRSMLQQFQSNYLIDPIRRLCRVFGIESVKFSKSQGETAQSKIEYEAKAIENALKLWQMGEDAEKYLSERGVVKADNFDEFWSGGGDDEADQLQQQLQRQMQAQLTNGNNPLQ